VVRQHQRGRALQAEGCGIAIGAASRQGSEGSARFQQAGSKGVVSPMEPLRGRVHRVQKVQRVQRVVDCPAGNAYKVSVTGLPFCHISRSKHGGESATSGGFSPFGAYGTTFPPQKRGHNKAPYSIPLISGSKVSTGCCPTACGGKVVAPATKGGAAFPSPAKAVVKVL
jgi:hypothetical protein